MPHSLAPFLSRFASLFQKDAQALEENPLSPDKGCMTSNPSVTNPVVTKTREDRVLATLLPKLYPRWCAPMCGNYKSHMDTPNRTETQQLPAEQQKTACSGREVRIDRSTSVPLELYWDLMKAGERAKRRGQHELKSSDRMRGSQPVLVRKL